jgi:hypothetical protein
MMKWAVLLAALAGCDPYFGASVTLHDPARRPVDNATLAIACADSGPYPAAGMSVRTKHDGTGRVGSIGGMWPIGCDIFIAKPGYRTHQIRYRELCPDGPDGCQRVFDFDLVLEPE